MSFEFSVPGPDGPNEITVAPGSSLLFVGANGGGKTRLAVHIESEFEQNAHRISAHRALSLNPRVNKISEKDALHGLLIGKPDEQFPITTRNQLRWQRKPAVHLLDDFDFLIQALFAEQGNRALETHKNVRSGVQFIPELTKFEQLVDIWQRLLPNRQLYVSGDNIEVGVAGLDARYEASEMSDGERAVFYLIGQTLTASKNALIIVDEPELHVHRSIMNKLWDELEAARQDCSFIFITHDLEFAASHFGQKFVIQGYDPKPYWRIENVPENTGFSEEIITLVLGGRRPVLFVEGNSDSLDFAMYRFCFPEMTVIPRGSCEEVIHSVVTMKQNSELTRVICSGIIDADGRDTNDVEYMRKLGIYVLPVSEIENVLLIPSVSRVIAECEGFKDEEVDAILSQMEKAIFEHVSASPKIIEGVVLRYCRRRIDRILKRVDLANEKGVEDIVRKYNEQIKSINVFEISNEIRKCIDDALRDGDIIKLLANYDDKGLISIAAQHLKHSKLKDFRDWLIRVLRNNETPALVLAIRNSILGN